MIEFKHNPTDSQRITSLFGNRTSPSIGFHHGIDIGAMTKGVQGDKIYSVADGVVVVSKVDSGDIDVGYGNYVAIQHNGFASLYGHLMELEVKVGQKVLAGEVIGHMGNTGDSTGVHLHFGLKLGLYFGGIWVNPLDYLLKDVKIMDTKTAIEILKTKGKLSDNTIQYLLWYKYGDELVKKLAIAIEGE